MRQRPYRLTAGDALTISPRRRRWTVVCASAVVLASVPLLPLRAADPDRWRHQQFRLATVPPLPALLMGANRRLHYVAQTQEGTAIQDLGFDGDPDDSLFESYGLTDNFEPERTPPEGSRDYTPGFPTAIGDFTGDENVDLVILQPETDPLTGPAASYFGSQRDGFPHLVTTGVDEGIRHVEVLEGGATAGAPRIILTADAARFAAIRWTGREFETVNDNFTLPSGLGMDQILDVAHRHDWDRERGEAKPNKDDHLVVVARTSTKGKLAVWDARYGINDKGDATFTWTKLTDLAFRSDRDPDVATVGYDWIPGGTFLAVRALYGRGGAPGYDADLAGATVQSQTSTFGPLPFCPSGSEPPRFADLDVEAVSLTPDRFEPFAACSVAEGNFLRTDVYDETGPGASASIVGNLPILSAPRSQLVFPCLWVLEHGPAGSRCSSNPGGGNPNQAGNYSVTAVVNAGAATGQLKPTYVSRSFNRQFTMYAQWHRQILDQPADDFFVQPLPHNRTELTVALDNLSGTPVQSDPVPLAFLAAPPHVKGAGQEADPPVFATTRSSSESAGDSLSTRVGGYVGVAAESPMGVFGFDLQVDIGNEVTEAKYNFLSLSQGRTFSGLVDDDTVVYQARSALRFQGTVVGSSTGVGLKRRHNVVLPAGMVTSAASVTYLRNEFPALYGEGGVYGDLPAAFMTHDVGNPGSYLSYDGPSGSAEGAAVDDYCDGSLGTRAPRDWRPNRDLPPAPDFPIEIPTVPKKPDVIMNEEPHHVLVGTGNSEGDTASIESGEETSRVATMSEDITVGGRAFYATFGATAGLSQTREASSELASGTEFEGSVGHIPYSNEWLAAEKYAWRMFVCHRTVPSPHGPVTAWVLNYTVDNYNGSGGLETMSPLELLSPRRSEIPLARQPELIWRQAEGTVHRYDWELEAVGAPDYQQSKPAREGDTDRGIVFASPAAANADRREQFVAVPPKSLREHQLYRWRVIATDFFDNQVVSPYEYFQTDGPPTAEFSASPTTAAAGEEIVFTNESRTSKVRPTTYEWDFGDKTGTVKQRPVPAGETPPVISHRYATSGVWTVTLKAWTDRGPDPDSEMKNIVVAASAVDDSYDTSEDGQLHVPAPGVLANDGAAGGTDTENDAGPVYASVAAPASHGTARLRPDGELSYVPEADFCGPDKLSYFVQTGDVRRAAEVTINVACVDDPPVAAPDSFSGAEDNPISVAAAGLLGNDRDADRQALSAVLTSAPARGRIVVNSDGSFAYSPDGDFCGEDRFTYQAQSGEGDRVASSAPTTAVITVACVNDLPVPGDDGNVSTDEDTNVTVPVLANDRDADGDSLVVTVAQAPVHGSAMVTPDRRIAYTPAANFSGPDVFTYAVDDSRGGTGSATVKVDVKPVNDAPTAVDDGFTIYEDTPVPLAVLVNDVDIDGDALAVSVTQPPSIGTAALNADGTIAYVPPANYFGGTSFTYTVDDGHGGRDPAVAHVTILPVNDPPEAADDVAATDEEDPISIGVLINDTDVDGDRLVVKIPTPPKHGTTVVNGDFSVTYRPAPGYAGPDTFNYTVDDQHGGVDTATVGIDVTAINDAPVAVADYARTGEDTPVRIEVLANDTDADGDGLTVTIASPALHGQAVANSDGTVTYVPDIDRNGVDVFTYAIGDGEGGSSRAQVTVGVGEANDPPALADDTATTSEDTAVVVNVLGNDRDPDGDRLTVAVAQPPGRGSATAGSDGAIRYTPERDFSGTETVRYTAADGRGEVRSATVTITVTPVNDAPIALGESTFTAEDTPIAVDVTANDSDADGDGLSVTVTVPPGHGRAAVDGSRVTYTPTADYGGTDSFTYTVSDGRGGASYAVVVIDVAPVNDPPAAGNDSPRTEEDRPVTIPVLINDRDADGDGLQVSPGVSPVNGSVALNDDGSMTYVPRPDFVGVDTFTYAVSDAHGGSATATVTVTMTPVNDVPVVGGDEAITDEDVPITVAVLGNDHDVDGDILRIVLGTLPHRGTATIAPAADAIIYTPDANAHGGDSFTYTVDDGHGGKATAPVNVAVRSVNDPPVALDDNRVLDEDATLTVNVLTNDIDVDGDPVVVTIGSAPGHGRADVTPENTIVYTPDVNYHGTDSLAYQLNDGHGGTATATVTISVTSVNDVPVGLPDQFVRQAGETHLTVPAPGVLANDSDVEGDALEARLFSGPTDGQVAMRPDGSFVYTPRPTHRGGDEFTYRVFDGSDYSEPIRVVINVSDCLDSPPDGLLDLAGYPPYVLCIVQRVVDDIVQLEVSGLTQSG